MADLVAQTYLAQCLPDLPAERLPLLPQTAAAASRLIRKFCNRYFNRQPLIDELYTADPGGTLLLRQFPVNGIARVATDPTAVISISNASAAVQRATVALSTTGSQDAGLTVTGVVLTAVASGVTTTTPLLFAGYPTVASLAAAVNALGAGWKATLSGTYDQWPTSDLRAGLGALPAAGGAMADLLIHVTDLDVEADLDAGIVSFGGGAALDPFTSSRWGPTLSTADGDVQLYGGFNGVRAVYDAGFDTVPEDLQQCTVEAVKAMLDRLGADTTLNSEADGKFAWTSNGLFRALPPAQRDVLLLYQAPRA